MLGTTEVVAAGFALLAFVVALYVLAARDQKTPYITNSVYSTAHVVLGAVLLSATGALIRPASQHWHERFSIAASVLLALGVANVFYRVWQAQNRKLHFRDDGLISNLSIVRSIKNLIRKQPSYEHNPVGLLGSLIEEVARCRGIPAEQLRQAVKHREQIEGLALSLSMLCRVSTAEQADLVLADLSLCFLKQKCWVQYVSCGRHPIEFLLHLRKRVNTNEWPEYARRIVAVDAYSPHFGFTDSIHEEARRRLENLGIKCFTANASYPSLHGASARTFNFIQKRTKEQGSTVRLPALLIYDEPYSIVDIESAEQYRIFIRHLLPSERLWGGMFTVVVESVITDEALSLIKSYTDVFADLDSGRVELS